jgi:hypothetical protein
MDLIVPPLGKAITQTALDHESIDIDQHTPGGRADVGCLQPNPPAALINFPRDACGREQPEHAAPMPSQARVALERRVGTLAEGLRAQGFVEHLRRTSGG